MTVTVLDNNDMPAIMADAGLPLESQENPETPASDKKPDTDGGKDASAHAQPHDDEGEDENGLTAEERAGLTEKMQRSIGKRHRMMKEAEEFAAAQYNERKLAEQRAAALERELSEARGQRAPEQKAATAPEKPTRESYSTDAEYIDAMIQYGIDERMRQRAEEDAKAAEQRQRETVIDAAKSRITRALELVPDYAEVTGAVDIEVPPAVAGYMQKSEMFAELGYHLAKNTELLVSLAKLPPDEQLVKIGKIESTLSPFGSEKGRHDSTSSKAAPNGAEQVKPSKSTGEPLSTSRGKAAPVFAPIDVSGGAGVGRDSADMNIREAIDDFSKRNRVNFSARKRH